MTTENILKIENLSALTLNQAKPILSHISLTLKKASTTVIMGPNGSGKSTLAHTIMGLPRFKVSQGKIIFNNQDITYLPTFKRAKLGLTLAFQEPAYFEGITTQGFIQAGSPGITISEIEKYLKLVGLEPKKFLQRKLDQTLSGGERKRIELASVMAMKAKLIILDEPDSGLDIILYRELYSILENIKKATKASILMITHREEPGFLADQAILLHQGTIMAQGDFRSVMRRYCQLVGRKKTCSYVK